MMSIERLSKSGSIIGADVTFFIHNSPSANVSGFGEIVEPFEEPALPLKLYTPPVGCDTALVYKTFKEYFLSDIRLSSFIGWDKLSSKELLAAINDPGQLNDLYPAALKAYPELEKYARPGWLFSGSGSTFFKVSTNTF